MNKVQKMVVYRTFQKKYCTVRQKRSREALNTNYTGFVKIKAYLKIKPRRQIIHFGLGPLVLLMCFSRQISAEIHNRNNQAVLDINYIKI